MVVVAHVLAQRLPPMALGQHVLGPADRQRRDRLDREAAGEAAPLVGLVELLRRDLRRWRLVHAQELGEPRSRLRRSLDHHVAPDLVVVVPEAVRDVASTSSAKGAAASRSRTRRRRPPPRAGTRSTPSATNATPVTRPDSSSSSTFVTVHPARISQPCSIASGRCVINGDAFAFTLQPSRQKPR